jgi:quinol monooxygenase YgiN
MSLIVAGTVRVPPENLEALRPAIRKMLTATRAEDGCGAYAFAEDLLEPGLIRIFELWRDQAALDAHFKTPHMAEWRATGAAAGLSDRHLALYEIAAEGAL